ncbi:MAG: hypothetical protein ACRDVM_01820, partial [Acidimicrobiia bacterium]
MTVGAVVAMALAIALAAPAIAWAQRPDRADCSTESVGLTPLTELGTDDYQGTQGGLYPGGSNETPTDHLALGLELASQVKPLDRDGSPHSNGLVGLLSIGVSNTRAEFDSFMQLAQSRLEVDPNVVLVNGARNLADADIWANDEEGIWDLLDRRVADAGLSPLQVQAAWIKVPERQERPEPFPAYAQVYAEKLEVVLQMLTDRFPNVRLAYLSSRVYGGYGPQEHHNTEPFAYQQGFGVTWVIEDQILGEADLNSDPSRGPIEAPWVAWGPYLWADGLRPRSDGLVWECADFDSDGIHPSPIGSAKAASLLYDYLATSATSTSWFTRPGSGGPEPSSAPTNPTTTTTATTIEVAPSTTTLDERTSVTSAPPAAG